MKHHEILVIRCDDIGTRCGDVGDLAELTAILVRSFLRYRHGVFADCGIGVTPQMCNRVTNHGDMGTFSRPDYSDVTVAVSCDVTFITS